MITWVKWKSKRYEGKDEDDLLKLIDITVGSGGKKTQCLQD